MIILAIDTAAGPCAACAFDTSSQRELARVVAELGRGHAERLIGIVEQTLDMAKIGYDELGTIAVNVGPGSFTGVRVGVSAARGFALALGIPSIGISALEALAEESGMEGPLLSAIDAGRGQVYAQVFSRSGRPDARPALVNIEQAAEMARSRGCSLVGSASLLIENYENPSSLWCVGSTASTADIGVYARLAFNRGDDGSKPRPLYLRPPDAKPQTSLLGLGQSGQ